MSEVCFTWPCRVYYEDTDGQGILYHARCLNFFERARTEWIRSLGINQSAWLARGFGFVVSSASLRYRAPAFLDDSLLATVTLRESRRTSFSVAQCLYKCAQTCEDEGEGDVDSVLSQGEALIEGEFRIVSIDMKRFRPCAIPPELTAVIGSRG